MTRLYTGITPRNDQLYTTQPWSDYGFDLDGFVTEDDFSASCQPNASAPPAQVFPDGHGGVDNAFGKKLLPLLKVVTDKNLDDEATAPITTGTWTLIFNLAGLGPEGDYAPVAASLLVGENRMDGRWQVRPEFLSGFTVDTAFIRFPESYLVTWPNGRSTTTTWVSGARTAIPLHLELANMVFDVEIHDAIVAMDLDGTHSKASNGTIAGVLDTEQLVAQLRVQAGLANAALCSSYALESILTEVRQASDIMLDGSQDPTRVCNGISFALGFDGEVTTIGDVGASAGPAPQPCDEDKPPL